MRGAFDFLAGRISGASTALKPILRCEGLSMRKHCDARPPISTPFFRGITLTMAKRCARFAPMSSFVLEIMHATG